MNRAQQPHKVIPMKTIGILGGMSSQATAEYYRLINAGINQVRGGWNAAELLICSVNFADIEAFVRREQWNDAANYLVSKAVGLERGGADASISDQSSTCFQLLEFSRSAQPNCKFPSEERNNPNAWRSRTIE